MTRLRYQTAAINAAFIIATLCVSPTMAQDDCAMSVAGGTYYVAPGGGGQACIRASPCTLNTGLSRASGGGEVILLDGTYRQSLQTRAHGGSGRPIVIRAENRHRATIESNDRGLDIDHNNIIVRDIRFDNRGRGRRGGGILDFHPTSTNSMIRNVIVENNIFLNAGHTGMYMRNSQYIVIRHNLWENTGLAPGTVGEGYYIGVASGPYPVLDVEIYGNTVRNHSENAIDYKSGVRRVNAHHNIFEHYRRKQTTDGMVRSVGDNGTAGNYFQDNIVRNTRDPVSYIVRVQNRVDVINNVFANISANAWIDGRSHNAAIIRGNTLCNTPTRGDRGGNRLNRPMAECNAEIARIQSEMANLPRCGDMPVWPDTPIAEERPDPEEIDWTTILGPVAVGGAAATIIPNVLPDSPKIGIDEFLGAMDSG